MADTQTRAVPRGRGSGRGGRGGFGGRGGRPRTASAKDAEPTAALEDEGEIGQLKKHYSTQLNTIREMFPDWTDEDLVFALQETDGDLEATIERISEGNVSQWGEVKKKTKERIPKKGKEAHELDVKHAGRAHGRGTDAPRGRARGGGGTERARSGRGRSAGPAVNGAKHPAAPEAGAEVPAANDGNASLDAAAPKPSEDAKADFVSPDTVSREAARPSEAIASPPAPPPPTAVAADSSKTSSKPDGTRSWASMLKPVAKPKPAAAKPKAAPVPPADPVAKEAVEMPIAGDAEIGKAPSLPAEANQPGRAPSVPPSDPPIELAPSKDALTETNLELVQDVSNPVATETAASNAGTDHRGVNTPLPSVPQTSSTRPSLGGFATTAQKATAGSNRSASYQRRVKDQQEAVVMPGNHAVDRAAVQFGSLGLGAQDDVDDDREEAETRQQPPQHSPVAPRASLPPAQQALSADAAPTSRPPGLPIASQTSADSATAQPQSINYGYNQLNNLYGGANQGDHAAQTKPYDSLGQAQQAEAQGYDSYTAQSQAAGQQTQGHGPYSSAGTDYSSYYVSDNQRQYQNYYNYGQQAPSQQPHETGAAQQKVGTGFGATNGDQNSTSASQNQASSQSRYNTAPVEGQHSGHSTPNPPVGHQPGTAPQSHQLGQSHGPAGGHGYPYNANPYYSHYSHYPSSYMNQVGHHSYGADRPPFDDARRYDESLTHGYQFGYGGRHQGYNQPYGGGGKYAQPHSYGMSSQSPFDPHAGSPGNAGPYGQPQQHPMAGRDNSTLGSYGRASSTQPSEGQSHSTSAFGGMSDVFNRTQSSYSAQTSQQAGGQQGGSDDPSRGSYTETSKIAGGPSPAPGQATARPGSAANLGGQSNPSTQGQGYGSYPSQMGMHGQQSQYGGGGGAASGLGGLGGHNSHHHQGQQSHQNSAYGAYGGGFGGNYYNSNARGGWGGNYGH